LQGRLSVKDGYEEQLTTGFSTGFAGFTRTAPIIESMSGIDSFRIYGETEGNIGALVFGDNGIDVQYNFGAQAVVGFNIGLSGKEILDFIIKVGQAQIELKE
jgi:hypothetical protein